MLALHCDELGNKEIALRLGIAHHTVRKILQEIRREKLRVAGRGALKLYVRENPEVLG